MKHHLKQPRDLQLESLESRQVFSGDPAAAPLLLAPAPAEGRVTLAAARVTLGNLADGCTPQVRVNSGPWTPLQADAAGEAMLPRLRQGANTAVFRQVAADGTPSTAQTVAIRFDSIAPSQPLVALRRAGPGGITNDPTLRIDRVENDARLQYSVNGGAWSTDYAPADGPNAVRIRALDDAGNASRPTAPVRFTLDRVAVAPAVALVADTGAPDDRITLDARLRVTGVEPGARVQYSTDDGRTWKRSFDAVYGPNDVLVRQVDRAGNVSPAAGIAFTKLRYQSLPNLVFSTSGNDGVKGTIKNLTDTAVSISKSLFGGGPGGSYILKPGAEVVFYDSMKIKELGAGCEGIDFFFSREEWAHTQNYHRIAIGDPDIGRPDTLYSAGSHGRRPHLHTLTVRRAWNEEESHEEVSYNRPEKTPTQFWIKRQIDGWNGGYETDDTEDWQVFTIHIKQI